MNLETQKSGSQKSGPKARNLAARLAAVQALYEYSQNKQPVQALVGPYAKGIEMDEAMVQPDEVLLKKIVGGVIERYIEINEIVKGHLAEKETARAMEPLLRAVLLAGTYELLAHHEIDFPIIINDYVNVVHGFYSPSEAGLVNAVLDKTAGVLREKA